MILLQYLEDNPDLPTLSSRTVQTQLKRAFDCLPISILVLGWNVPARLIQVCADETARAGAQLYYWYPLFTGRAGLILEPEWWTVGLGGERLPGFRNLPEFTFFCPNNEAAAELTLEHFLHAIQDGPYQGVFLDRIRYPSPATDPSSLLACFCADCQRAARIEGFDLEDTRCKIKGLLARRGLQRAVIHQLLDPSLPLESLPDLVFLSNFLDFRAHNVTRFVQTAAEIARREGLAVGLDCFSPAIAYMVGQNLAALDQHCDWIKVMTYGHTHAPAGLPFELLALARWLTEHGVMDETEALECLAQTTHLPLPATSEALLTQGLSPQALSDETRHARYAGITTLLAGIELVDLPSVTQLSPKQIAADLRGFRAAQPAGLALSWDLRWIPPAWLQLVHDNWLA